MCEDAAAPYAGVIVMPKERGPGGNIVGWIDEDIKPFASKARRMPDPPLAGRPRTLRAKQLRSSFGDTTT